MEQAARRSELAAFGSLIGEWTVEATHPMLPSTVIAGRTTYEWLEGERFLIQRSSMDHPEVPDSISVVGFVDDELTAHYFDSRGVFRIYRIAMEGDTLRMSRDHPGFSQRLEAKLSDVSQAGFHGDLETRTICPGERRPSADAQTKEVSRRAARALSAPRLRIRPADRPRRA